LKVAFEIK